MASVTSLDQDMRNLRLARYTPQAASEIRAWIETTLGEPLPPGDLLDALRDGVVLCKLANLVLQGKAGAIKFKKTPMPFIQMENISHFLKACEMPPLSLPAHDRFLTVDLYEQKDPAQVLQCLGAFSRQAHQINPTRFTKVVGPRRTGTVTSSTVTENGRGLANGSSWRRPPSPEKQSAALSNAVGPLSPAWTGGSIGMPRPEKVSIKPSSGPVSSWSKRSDEGSTTPAWNTHQYGYMGGASQGNQGISFGARRQITSHSPTVPSFAEKERVRKEKEAEVERQRQQQAEEQDRQRQAAEAEEEKERAREEHEWEEETRRQREAERKRLAEQKQQWEEQERRWNKQEEVRRREDATLQASLSVRGTEATKLPTSNILRGQTLTEYQKEQVAITTTDPAIESTETPEQKRVRELEQQLEEARERERQYRAEREERLRKEEGSRPSTADTTRPQSAHESEVSWAGDEREYLRQHGQNTRDTASKQAHRPLPAQPACLPPRPLPEPVSRSRQETPVFPSRPQPLQSSAERPPDIPQKAPGPDPGLLPSRTDDLPAARPSAPSQPSPSISSSHEAGHTSLEKSQLRDIRLASQQKTKAGGWASKSLLEREMERERERQKEWEANQQALTTAPRDPSQGPGVGQTWDVNQYGYMGGDNMNRGSSVGSGINFGGHRPIIGPRSQK